MDFGDVFRIVGRFFIDYCNIAITVFGYTFTVGSLFIWCAVALVLVAFVRGLAS